MCVYTAAGSKLYTFMERWDNDFVDATGKTVPPALAAQRLFGTQVTCGRFARQFVSPLRCMALTLCQLSALPMSSRQ